MRLGLNPDSNKALYASRMVTVPLPSSSAPWGHKSVVFGRRHDASMLTRGGKEWEHVGACGLRECHQPLERLASPYLS